MSKTISTRIDNTLHKKLVEQCNTDGITINDYLKNFVEEDLNIDSDTDEELDIFKEIIEESREDILREFDAKNGRLIENGIDIGNTLDYELNFGNVYEDDKLIGKIV